MRRFIAFLWCLPALFAAPVFSQIDFQQIMLPGTLNTYWRFDANWHDWNGDGCLEPSIPDHGSHDMQLWEQGVTAGRCDGSFGLVDDGVANYRGPFSSSPRGAMLTTVLDFDGDGDEDYTWQEGEANKPPARYENLGDGTFATKDFECNSQGGGADGKRCSYGDFNGDGRIDYVVRSTGTIHDWATDAPNGQITAQGTGSAGRVKVSDLDSNGWPDIITPTGTHMNSATGFVFDPTLHFNGGLLRHLVAADFDNDGDLDVFNDNRKKYCNGETYLFRNDGGSYTEIGAASGLQSLGCANFFFSYSHSLAADFDNDGWQDILTCGTSRAHSCIILRNRGGMQFDILPGTLGASGATGGNGGGSSKPRGAVADYDEDGLLDIIKTQAFDNAGLWRNTTQNAGNWIRIRVRGENNNSEGLHTRITVTDSVSGDILGYYHVEANHSHHQRYPHVGLGTATNVDLLIEYPHGGPSYTFADLAVNQEVHVYYNGEIVEGWLGGLGWPLVAGPPLPMCESFEYGPWGECQPDDTRSRVVTSSEPVPCQGGNPVLTQSCVYVPPPAPDVIVIVARDAETSSTGSWGETSSATTMGYNGDTGLWAAAGGNVETYTFAPPVDAGSWSVEFWNSCYSPRVLNVTYRIEHATGTSEVIAPQDCNQDEYAGDWRPLGVYQMDVGIGSLTVDTDGAQPSYIGVTAARFTRQ